MIGRSLGIFFKNFIPFILICTIALLPVVAWVVHFVATPITFGNMLERMATLKDQIGIVILAGFVLSFLAAGGVTYGVIQQLRGQHASMFDCLRVGVSRMLAVIGVTVLTILALMGPLVPVVLVASAMGGFGAVIAIAGLIFVLTLYCRLWVAVPVAVIERPGVVASLTRSSTLTEGSRFSIFGVLFITGLLRWVGQKLGEVMVDLPGAARSSFDTLFTRLKIYILVVLVLNILFAAFSAVCCAVAYHDLRTGKEGTSVDELASVFD
ncbi:MAG: hypothetical protein IT370_16775 [Deltaproteobacteria bacterium]|nr:hypothetical protein [Deltaproteobacteria bacterium]